MKEGGVWFNAAPNPSFMRPDEEALFQLTVLTVTRFVM